MINTILVPIDIDHIEAGASALEMARTLARGQDAKFFLLNVLESVPAYLSSEIPSGIYKTHRSAMVERLTEFAREHHLPDTTEIVVREGHASTEILEFAEKCGADLIVIGSHNPGFADYLIGSVATRVVRHAHCSVLVAR